MTEKEKYLLAGCIRGDKASWDAFVLQYSNLVYHTIRKTFALHHTKPNEDAVEDLFQEFFLAILRDDFKKLRQFRGECTLASWARLVCARLTVDFLRRQPSPPSEASYGFCGDSAPLNSLIATEEERLLNRAIEQLLPRDRLFMDLCFGQGASPEDIAGILKISVGAVYTQKNRILSKIREIIEKADAPLFLGAVYFGWGWEVAANNSQKIGA